MVKVSWVITFCLISCVFLSFVIVAVASSGEIFAPINNYIDVFLSDIPTYVECTMENSYCANINSKE